MEIALAPLTLHRPPPLEVARVAGEAGYDAVGFQLALQHQPASPLCRDAAFRAEARRGLDHFGLSLLEVSNLFLEPGRDRDDGRALVEFAAAMGARIVQVAVFDDNRDRVLEHLSAVCDHGEAEGLVVCVEFMPYSELRSFSDAVRLVTDCGRPNAKILLDTLHFVRSNSVVSELAGAAADLVAYVQVADGRARPPARERLREEALADRLPLGEGALPVREIVDALGREVPLSIEIPCRRLESLSQLDQARTHLEIARRYFAARP